MKVGHDRKEIFKLRVSMFMSMELYASDLNFSRLVLSNSLFYFLAVSNLILLLMIIFYRWFS